MILLIFVANNCLPVIAVFFYNCNVTAVTLRLCELLFKRYPSNFAHI